MAGTAPAGEGPACGAEALALLNCVAGEGYSEGKCAAQLEALRACTQRRKVIDFSVGGGGAADKAAKAKGGAKPSQ